LNRTIREIRKALARAHNNPNQGEAQAALLLAQQLAAKHHMSVKTITKDSTKKMDTGMGKVDWWQRRLAFIVADRCNCHPVIIRGTCIGFIGDNEDTEIAKRFFEFSSSAILTLSSTYLVENKDGRSRRYVFSIKNDYIHGFLHGLDENFSKPIKIQLEETPFDLSQSAEIDKSALLQGYLDGKNFEPPMIVKDP
jgi:hypothetical protein